MATIAVIGTLDTKGREHQYVADCISQSGHQAHLIDVGTGADPQVIPYLSREAVAAAAGLDLASLRKDRGLAVAAMSEAAPKVLLKLIEQKKIHGVISLGGGGGTAIATAAMRALPLGFPKVMVSTLASGNTAPYIGSKDIVMIPSVVDISGLNRISRPLLAKAAGAICGMVETSLETQPAEDRPLIVASMFGNTTAAVESAKAVLEKSGYEVVVFHATGTGGRTMESIIEAGMASGVLDLTTTEWADEVVGGILSAGPTRLEAAAKSATPAIVVPGCVDMVNFGAPETVPAAFKGRLLYAHNPQATLLRTSPAECAEIGKRIAAKVNLSTGPVTVLLPLQGVSALSSPGGAFHSPEADQALFQALRSSLLPTIPVLEIDAAVNDPSFAEACAQTLLQLMQSVKK
jgi:uncharacterized protein (UPF0261 family)